MSRFAFVNGLTAEENERLSLLAEECAEVIQVVSKIQRHGFESTDPTKETPMGSNPTNRQLLEKELGDVDAAVMLLTRKDDIGAGAIAIASRRKLERLTRWLHMEANLTVVRELLK